MSKVAVQDIELQTGESIIEYINTAAIAINLMFECGFRVSNDIIHYYQLIETQFAETNKVAFIKNYFKDEDQNSLAVLTSKALAFTQLTMLWIKDLIDILTNLNLDPAFLAKYDSGFSIMAGER